MFFICLSVVMCLLYEFLFFNGTPHSHTISRKKQHEQESKKHLKYLKYYNLIDKFKKISI